MTRFCWVCGTVLALLSACNGIVARPDVDTTSDGGHADAGTDAVPGEGSMEGAAPDAGVHHDASLSDVVVSDGPGPEGDCPGMPAPTFDPPSGSVNPVSVQILDPSVTSAGGLIFYTNDGTNPTQSSPVYSGPIEVLGATTLRAVAVVKGCVSEVGVATYVVEVADCCGLEPFPPTLTPSSKMSDNDFLVAAQESTGPGATICYTLDGTTPTCNGGACTGVSQTYNAATLIAINGSVTNTSTGQVTLTAIACEAGYASSSEVTLVYTLQADPPAMSNPAPSTSLAADAGTVTPTIQSQTVDSLQPANAVSIHTSTDPQVAPTCSSSPSLANGGTVIVSGTTSVQAITCKAGYLPSAVTTFDYAFGP